MATVGIDLGTTTTLVAYLAPDGTPKIVKNLDGELATPSVVYFEGPRKYVVGTHARAELAGNASYVVEAVKHFMGEDVSYDFHGKDYRPEEISAIILRRVVQDASEVLGEPVEAAVITVPAIMGEAGRAATREAAKIAGLPLLALLDEPVAAALSYSFRSGDHEPRTFVLYDLGGGTFDITVVRIDGKGGFQVLATDGDRRLGGKDWDQRLLNVLADRHVDSGGEDPRMDTDAYQDLMRTAETLKKGFARKDSQNGSVSYGGRATRFAISRDEFRALTEDLTNQTLSTTRMLIDGLKKSGKLPGGWKDVDEVLLAGGSSRLPHIQVRLEGLTDRPVRQLDVDQVVAEGAAIYAGMLAAQGKATQTGETVAAPQVPASVQRRLAEAKVESVCSFALGISVVDNATGRRFNDVIVPANTPLPARFEAEYGSPGPGRTAEIPLLEGDSPDPADCRLLGQGVLRIPFRSRPGGLVRITVGLDEQGLIQVSAQEPEGAQVEFEVRREHVIPEEQVAEAKARLSLAVVE